MESQSNLSQPEQSYHPKHHIKVYVWIALVVAAFLVAINGYVYFLRLSYYQQGAETARQNEQSMQELMAKRSSSADSGQFEVPSNWKTYRNEEYGFEFRYPKILNLEESGYHKNDIIVWASLVSLRPSHIPGDPANIPSIDIGASKIDSTVPKTNTVVNGVLANKYKSETEMGVTYSYDLYPSSGDFIFNLTLYNSSNSSLIKNDVELFDQILSTFKFIGQ